MEGCKGLHLIPLVLQLGIELENRIEFGISQLPLG